MAKKVIKHADILLDKKKIFLKQYDETKCNLKISLLRAGITHQTLLNYKNDDPEFELAIAEVESLYDDLVIAKFWDKIEAGHYPAIERYLNKKRFKDTIYAASDDDNGGNLKYTFTVSKINEEDGSNSETNE